MKDPVIVLAEWLSGHAEWMRHTPVVDEFLTDVEACARVIRGIARGPAAQRYLGPCGAPTVWTSRVGVEGLIGDGPPCEGDVYGRDGAETGTCRTCKATVSQDERKEWLDEQVRDRAYRAAHIADAYRISVDTIRSWALRGHLPSYWRNEDDLIVPWVDPVLDRKLTGEQMKQRLGEIADEIRARGGRLHYVGDVLELAREAAARRAENEAKRAVREAAEMGA